MDEVEDRFADFLLFRDQYEEHPSTNPIDDDCLKALVVEGVPELVQSHLQLHVTKISQVAV